MESLRVKETLLDYKNIFFESKKYWIVYLCLILASSLCIMTAQNYAHPKIEIATIILLSILGIFSILFYQRHNDYDELYKTAFVIILIFGILCCFLSPIMCGYDEAEHFVRSEMTSSGVIFPEYNNGSYLTIKSTEDLKANCNETLDTKFDAIDTVKASILKTDADTKPINYSLVEYPSAFAQNPFFGYIPQAIGMAIAKLFDMNAIWLLWLGRIFNVFAYAALVALAIRKTPILKVPLTVISIIPLTIFTISSVSIDSLINGLGIYMVAYFFYMYKMPKKSITMKNILFYSVLALLLGLCKITLFVFILLLLFVPRDNFENKQLYYKSLIPIAVAALVSILWVKLYANTAFLESFRSTYWLIRHDNSTQQISYILTHKKDFILGCLQIPNFLDADLFIVNSRAFWFSKFNTLHLIFLGGLCLFYPAERFNIKSKVGALIISLLVYFATYMSLLIAWTPVGQLDSVIGVQLRYFIPIFGLIPFIFGINHMDGDKGDLDSYIIVIAIAFLAMMLISLVCTVY